MNKVCEKCNAEHDGTYGSGRFCCEDCAKKSKAKRKTEDILQKNTHYGTHRLKLRLLKEGLIKNECFKCGQGNIWNGKELSLQLHHKNGDERDNRLENLEILCPNCHTQTDSYAGKNKKMLDEDKKKYYCECGEEKSTNDIGDCWKCKVLKSQTITRPSKEELLKLIKNNSFVSIGKMFNMSDNSIRKWCKSYDLPYKLKDIKML